MYGVTVFSSGMGPAHFRRSAANELFNQSATVLSAAPENLRSQMPVPVRHYDHLNLVCVPWGLKPEQTEDATLAIVEGMR